MTKVMIRCPVTQKPIPPGLVMDPRPFELAALVGKRVRCLECGDVHAWRKADAWLEREEQ